MLAINYSSTLVGTRLGRICKRTVRKADAAEMLELSLKELSNLSDG
jgi:hypothetical protein